MTSRNSQNLVARHRALLTTMKGGVFPWTFWHLKKKKPLRSSPRLHAIATDAKVGVLAVSLLVRDAKMGALVARALSCLGKS